MEIKRGETRVGMERVKGVTKTVRMKRMEGMKDSKDEGSEKENWVEENKGNEEESGNKWNEEVSGN